MTYPPDYPAQHQQPTEPQGRRVERLEHCVLYRSCRVLVVPLHPKTGDPVFDLATVATDSELNALGYQDRESVALEVQRQRERDLKQVLRSLGYGYQDDDAPPPAGYNLGWSCSQVEVLKTNATTHEKFLYLLAETLGLVQGVPRQGLLDHAGLLTRKLRGSVAVTEALERAIEIVEASDEEPLQADPEDLNPEVAEVEARYPVLRLTVPLLDRLEVWADERTGSERRDEEVEALKREVGLLRAEAASLRAAAPVVDGNKVTSKLARDEIEKLTAQVHTLEYRAKQDQLDRDTFLAKLDFQLAEFRAYEENMAVRPSYVSIQKRVELALRFLDTKLAELALSNTRFRKLLEAAEQEVLLNNGTSASFEAAYRKAQEGSRANDLPTPEGSVE